MPEMWSQRMVTGAGNAIRLTRPRMARDGRLRNVLVLGGLYSTADTWADGEPTATYKPSAIVCHGRGLAVASVNVDTTFGNATMQARITDAVDTLQASGYWSPGRISIIGGSTGGVCALTWALANPTLIRKMVLGITPFDLQRLYDDDWSGIIQDLVDAAWSGRPGDEDNPFLRTDELTKVPMKIYAGVSDPISPYEDAVTFAQETGGELLTMNTGHDFADPYDTSEIAEFLGA